MGDPMDLVSHVNRSKTGMTKMQVQLSIEMRAGMAEASKRLGMSQLSLIRSAISAFLQDHGAKTGEISLQIPEACEVMGWEWHRCQSRGRL